VLLNPGPVNVHPSVREALAYPDVCHREPEVAELIAAVRDKATRVCGGDEEFTSLILAGSGTAALEAAFASIVPADGKILILDNGHYGARLHGILTVHGIPCEHLEFGWGAPMDLDRIDAALAADPAITHIGLVHHETSSGLLNPLRAIGQLAARYERSLAVDAISSLGSEPLDMRADHLDWCVGTANKSLEGLPGVSFVCARRSALDALADVPRRTYYLDVHSHYLSQDRDGAPLFTPAVQVLYAFDRALDLTLEETPACRASRYGALAHRIRAGLEARGFELVLPEEQRANELTLVRLPDGVSYSQLHDGLRQDGFVVYATQPEYGQVFRVANMGQLTTDDVDNFLAALDRTMATLSAPALT
jgi:2-aminoethylphosphonate-pyruvate transaminase